LYEKFILKKKSDGMYIFGNISPAELWWNLALEYKVFLNADY